MCYTITIANVLAKENLEKIGDIKNGYGVYEEERQLLLDYLKKTIKEPNIRIKDYEKYVGVYRYIY